MAIYLNGMISNEKKKNNNSKIPFYFTLEFGMTSNELHLKNKINIKNKKLKSKCFHYLRTFQRNEHSTSFVHCLDDW